MLKKLWADKEKRDGLLFCIMTVVFTFALYLGSTSLGFVSTFPVFFVCAFVVFLFYRQLKNALVITAILSLAVTFATSGGNNSIVESSGSSYTLKFALLIMLFSVIGAWAAYLVAGWVKTKTVGGWIKTAVVLVLYLVCFNYFYGNIFGAVKWHSYTADYLKANYPNQKFDSLVTSFDFETGNYRTIITFTDHTPYANGEVKIGEERMELEANYDGYFLYAKERIFEMGKSVMKTVIREELGSGIGFVVNNLPFADKEMVKNSMFDLGGDYSAVIPNLSYEIQLTDEVTSLDDFSTKCQSIADALSGKFEFYHIEFYGGEKGIVFPYKGVLGNSGVLTAEEFAE